MQSYFFYVKYVDLCASNYELFCMLTDKANAMIVSPDYDWVLKTLRTFEMYT